MDSVAVLLQEALDLIEEINIRSIAALRTVDTVDGILRQIEVILSACVFTHFYEHLTKFVIDYCIHRLSGPRLLLLTLH